MTRQQRWQWAMGMAIVWALAVWPTGALAQMGAVEMEWLSWSIFRFTSPTGRVVVTNPFVTNPDSPVKVDNFPKVDVILVADGHGDEVGSADELALKTRAMILAPGEMMRNYFADRELPEQQFRSTNSGDWHRFDGLTVRGVNSVHGSGTRDKMYGGPALGFVMQFENGLTVYFSGSTALTLDMQLWGSLYKPDVAILPLSGRRDPQDIVPMVRLLRTDNPNLKTIIPHHHRLKPAAGAPTPADMEQALKAAGLPVTVLNPELSKVYDLTK
jgi:L-ascorbate metabolism protein UlaG (beta-lactamase superfamily)